MISLDATTHVFIWVPGTGGHEVHPAFKAAAIKATKGDCQFVVIDYPASVDFIGSVKKGIVALTKVLNEVDIARQPHQKIYLAGSSQGSWVISDTLYTNEALLAIPDKVVLFGHPGLSANHHHFDDHHKIWEIDNPNDAVTFGWNTVERKEISKALSDIYKLKPHGITTLIKYSFKRPLLLWRLFVLIVLHTKLINWVTSPHDYSNEMPLAVYWLVH